MVNCQDFQMKYVRNSMTMPLFSSSQPPSDEQPEAVIEDTANPVSKNSEKSNSHTTLVRFYQYLSNEHHKP